MGTVLLTATLSLNFLAPRGIKNTSEIVYHYSEVLSIEPSPWHSWVQCCFDTKFVDVESCIDTISVANYIANHMFLYEKEGMK